MVKSPWLWAILLIGWSWFCLDWYCCHMQTGCAACYEEPLVPYPIAFQAESSEMHNGNDRDGWIAGIMEERKKNQGNVLEITGKYFGGERSELGMERAQKIQILLQFEGLKDSELTLRTQRERRSLAADEYAEAYAVQWIKKQRMKSPGNNTFRFALHADTHVFTDDEKKYLNVLSQFLQQTSSTVKIVGHTDNTGLPTTNETISLNRAQTIASALFELGVDKEKVVIESKVDRAPIADNNTAEGRALNRRVEILIREN